MNFSNTSRRIANHPFRDIAYLIIIHVSALTISPIVLAYSMDPLMVAFWRCLIGGLFFLPFALVTQPKFWREINLRQWGLMLIAGLALAIHLITYMEGLYQVSLAIFYTIMATGTIWVGLLSLLVFKQMLTTGQWAGLIAGFGGIALYAYVGNTFAAKNLGSLVLLLIAASTFALYMIIGQRVRSTVSNFAYVAIIFTFAAIVCLVYALITQQSVVVASTQEWVGIALITFFGQIVVHALTNLYLKHGQPAVLQLTGLIKIPIIAIVGWLLFSQEVSLVVIPALLITVAGLIIYNLAQPKSA
jgi:drug/metabolite transporter (DMT)-like permease